VGRDQHHHIGADQADRWRKNARKRRWRWRPEYLCALVLVPLAAFFAFNSDTLGIVGGLMPAGGLSEAPTEDAMTGSPGSCDIKGNVSINTREHIYHLPGQKYYSQTIIRPVFGKKWFCSEA
jgi:hypothetical protein